MYQQAFFTAEQWAWLLSTLAVYRVEVGTKNLSPEVKAREIEKAKEIQNLLINSDSVKLPK